MMNRMRFAFRRAWILELPTTRAGLMAGIFLLALGTCLIATHVLRLRLLAEHTSVREFHHWLRAHEEALRAIAAAEDVRARTSADGSLLTWLTETSQHQGLLLQHATAQSDGSVTVQIRDAHADVLFLWISEIAVHRTFVLERVSMERAAQPGLVHATLRVGHEQLARLTTTNRT